MVDNDTTEAFDPNNDLYYISGHSFVMPEGVDAGGADFHYPVENENLVNTPLKLPVTMYSLNPQVKHLN